MTPFTVLRTLADLLVDPDVPVDAQTYGAAVLSVAQGWLGATETSRNRGPVVDEIVQIGRGNPLRRSPWCALFASACHVKAARTLGCFTNSPVTGGAARSWQIAGKRGLLRVNPRLVLSGEVELLPGDWMVMARPSAGRWAAATIRGGNLMTGHVGIVESYADGKVTCIEGNTTPRGQTETRRREGVWRVTRPVDAPYMVGFFRPTSRAAA